MALEIKYDKLSSEIKELLNKLEERDDIWIDYKSLDDPNFPKEKVNQNIQDYIQNLIKERTEIWSYVYDINQQNKNLKNKLDIEFKNLLKKDCGNQNEKYNHHFEKKKSKKIFTLVICLLFLVTFFFNKINKIITLIGCLTVSILYVLYLFKVIYIDRINRNRLYFNKYDFNKPTETEMRTARVNKDGEYQEKNTCQEQNNNIVSNNEELILEKVEKDTQKQKDKKRCLLKNEKYK